MAFLAELYGEGATRPHSYDELRRELPDLRDELDALEARSESLFAAAAEDHLRSLGVLASEDDAPAPTAIELAAEDVDDVLLEQHRPENRLLEEARQKKVSATQLAQAIDGLRSAFGESKEIMGEAARAHYLDSAKDPTAEDAYLSQMRGVAAIEQQALPYLQRMLDAFGVQQREGTSAADLARVAAAIKDFDACALAGLAQVDYEDVPAVEHADIFHEAAFLRNTKTALRYVVSNYLDRHASAKDANALQEFQDIRSGNGTAIPLTAVEIANLQRKEAGLVGLDLDIYHLVRKLGGSVDIPTMKEQLSISKDADSLYLYRIMPLVREGLLVERVERMPFTYEGERCRRFYTWWQRDTDGNPRLDRQAYHQWLCGRLEALSHRQKIASLSQSRGAFIAFLRECDPDDATRQDELRAEITDIDERINRLNGIATENHDAIARLDQALDALTHSEGFASIASP